MVPRQARGARGVQHGEGRVRRVGDPYPEAEDSTEGPVRHMLTRIVPTVALTLLPAVTSAQIVRGDVKVRGDTAGVSGVVVLLLDSAGATVGRALTDARGDYRIVAPSAGTYRLRTMRVGFRPDTSAA